MSEEHDKIHGYIDAAGEWRWRKVAPNGVQVSASGEGFGNRADAIDSALRELGDGAAATLDLPDEFLVEIAS